MAAKILVGANVCLWAEEPTGGVWILSGYCEAFVNLLKEKVPWRERSWNRDSCAWWVADSWADWAIGCAELLYRKCERRQLKALFAPVPEAPGAYIQRIRAEVLNGPPSQSEAWAWRILWLRSGAPAKMIPAAKKALAQHYHPDRAPDALERMVEVNQAVDILKTALKGRGQWLD